MSSPDAILFCYRNPRATEFVVDNFRLNFPESRVSLIVDKGGLDFKEYAKSKNLYVVENSDYNLGGTGPNAYLESNRAISLINRMRRALENLSSDSVLILEDDVFVKQKFNFSPDILPAGHPSSGNYFPDHIAKKWFGFSATWGMCGGAMLSKQFFLSISDEVIEWTKLHHDDMMREFRSIGAGDCLMSFHFARHGKLTLPAPWLQDGSVIHPYKNLYPPGWKPDNQVEW